MTLPTVHESLSRRICYRHEIGDNLRRQAVEMAKCARDVVRWITHWCFTYDPREKPGERKLPFDLFPKQVEMIQWVQERRDNRENGLIEKSRDSGASYVCCAYALHAWLFEPEVKIGFGSNLLKNVDEKGDPDCLFEKLRFMLRNLPPWMQPVGFDWKRHDNLMRLLNPENKSAITGECGDNLGRGGRTSMYFVDEAAHLEHPEAVDSALSENTDVRIDVSTPNGPGNPFARKRFGGNVAVFSMHWKSDPRKNHTDTLPDGRIIYPWYEWRKKKLDNPVDVASQLDIDYNASIEGICIPATWVQAAVGLDLPHSGPIICGLDVANSGTNVLTPRQGVFVGDPIAWQGEGITQNMHKAADQARYLRAARVQYDSDGIGLSVRSSWNTSEMRLNFIPVAVSGAGSPTDAVWSDGRTSKERFINLRAELWWLMRERFRRTWEYVEQRVQHATQDLISIPDCRPLIAELSLPRYFHTDRGRIKIESKDDLRKRGVKSPDYADSLCYTFAPYHVVGRPVAAGGVAAGAAAAGKLRGLPGGQFYPR